MRALQARCTGRELNRPGAADHCHECEAKAPGARSLHLAVPGAMARTYLLVVHLCAVTLAALRLWGPQRLFI